MTIKNVNKIKLLNKLGLVDKQVLSSVEEKPLVSINDLSVNFRRGGKLFEAVKGANIQIKDGEIVGLVGESGSGKTTLGRATLSLWDHAQGSVEIDGKTTPKKRIKSVSSKNIWVYKKGQMIYQDPTSSLNRQKKVLDIVNEGLKNFKTITNEYQELIENETKLVKEAEATIKALGSIESYEAFMKDYYKKVHMTEVISKSTDKKLLKFIEDFNSASEMKERIESLEKELKNVDAHLDEKIKIIKDKKHSDKVILADTTQTDLKFLETSKNNEIAEFAKLQKSAIDDEGKLIKRVSKRQKKFFKKITRNVKQLPTEMRSAIPSDYSDIKGLEKAVKALSKVNKLNDEQKFYATSIAISLKVLIKKQEKLVNPLNTAAYDFIYLFANETFLNRIHFYNKLLRDLEIRLELEEQNRKQYEGEKLEKFYIEAIEYLNQYKDIIISLIKEFAYISIDVKNFLLDHEENGIKHFYKQIFKINKLSDTLQASLITWKSGESVKYHQRLKNKTKILIKEEINELKESLTEIENSYNDIHNPSKDIEFILEDEFNKFEEEYKITSSVYKKELAKVGPLTEALEEANLKIKDAKKVLKNKKYRRQITIDRIKETLLKVGLQEDSLNKYPSQFSGGQKQRIGIARTIITKPKYIVADEPISALDVSVQAQVINLLKDIHQEMGLTMLFIAHDLQMVHYISDKIAVIYRGTIVEYGDADKVYKTPVHPYTKSLIGAMPSIEEVGKPLEVSEYSWDQHEYNEFSMTKLHEIEEGHFVFGTAEEIKDWK